MQGELSASLLDLITCSCVNRAMTQATGHDRWGYDQLTAIPLKTDMSPARTKPASARQRNYYTVEEGASVLASATARRSTMRCTSSHDPAKPCSRYFTASIPSTFELSTCLYSDLHQANAPYARPGHQQAARCRSYRTIGATVACEVLESRAACCCLEKGPAEEPAGCRPAGLA